MCVCVQQIPKAALLRDYCTRPRLRAPKVRVSKMGRNRPLLAEQRVPLFTASAVQILDRIILWTCSAADDLLLALHRMPAFLDDNHGVSPEYLPRIGVHHY